MLFILGVACCTVGPDYEPTEVAVPDAWSESIATDQRQAFTGSQRWWQKFKDPTLNKFITLSRESNPNIAIGKARIIEGWHQRQVLSAALYPQANFLGRDEHGLADFNSDGIDFDFNGSEGQLAQIDVGWELDIFGRISRQVESAEAEYESRIEGLRDIAAFIQSEVALSYIAYRTLEARKAVAEENIEIFKKINDLVFSRKETGVASELEFHESLARVKGAEAELPRIEEEMIVARNRIATLVGRDLKVVSKVLSAGKRGVPVPPSSIAVGIPANMLRSRPDVRRAERRIAAQTALIGVATSELYPQFSLSGALTYEFLRSGVTVETFRRTLGFGPTIRWRIWNACANKHRISEREAQLDVVISAYQGTVLNALNQVENSITRIHYNKKSYTKLKDAAEQYKKTAELMNEAYDNGSVDLRRLLNAHRDYIIFKDESLSSQGRIGANAVRLYKALGGGELQAVSGTKKR